MTGNIVWSSHISLHYPKERNRKKNKNQIKKNRIKENIKVQAYHNKSHSKNWVGINRYAKRNLSRDTFE